MDTNGVQKLMYYATTQQESGKNGGHSKKNGGKVLVSFAQYSGS
jgi:hypothetical protein